ncbi:hypothetical protein AURDEDRAFT_63120 [Auricularia subglabra TFB-10046 SS5]|nr:hypothetical protein AURDEDRAFT_63120 [Auricularia subglabra TFB-10046 SS5]
MFRRVPILRDSWLRGWVADHPPIVAHPGGWKRSTLRLRIPHNQKKSSPHHPVDPEACLYDIPDVLHRSLVDVILDTYSRPSATGFHFTPFKLLWKPPYAPDKEENVYGEIFSSLAFDKAHEAVQALPPEPNCDLPRAVAAVMLMSDAAHLSDNGRAKIHPLNFMAGNQTLYERRKPSNRAVHPIAYFPELSVPALQSFLRRMPGGKAYKKDHPIFTHCRRELFHGVLGLVLNEEFWLAYEHGIVVDCADGIRRRLYPRFFTYTADYPEKCAVTTIRDQGAFPCPNDLTPDELLDQMGTEEAREFQRANPRSDDLARRKSVDSARRLIHKQGYVVNSKRVDEYLKKGSYVPTKNAFSDPRNKDDIFSLPVPDPMHEGGAGTWLAILQHLIRILRSLPDGEEKISTLNDRYAANTLSRHSLTIRDHSFRAVGSFGHDAVRQLSQNVADLTLMKIYEYESALKVSWRLRCVYPDILLPRMRCPVSRAYSPIPSLTRRYKTSFSPTHDGIHFSR